MCEPEKKGAGNSPPLAIPVGNISLGQELIGEGPPWTEWFGNWWLIDMELSIDGMS
jgi:hypothetical protein